MAKIVVCDFCDLKMQVIEGEIKGTWHEVQITIDDRNYGDLDLCDRCWEGFSRYILGMSSMGETLRRMVGEDET